MSNSANEISASLFFDSWLDEIPELRAETGGEDRHLIYEGEGVILDLLLRLIPHEASFLVSGQVLPGTCDMESFDQVANLPVSMEKGESLVSTHTNTLGEFMFDPVSDGTWNLAIAFTNRRFVVRGLSNQEPRRWRSAATDNLGGH